MYRAHDVMSADVVTVHQETPVEDAIRTLLEKRISGAPVVDDQGQLLGIISEFQLLEAVYTPEVKRQQVRNLMDRDVLTVKETTILSDVANMLVMHRIRRIPVVRDGEVVGIIARRDLLRYVLDKDDSLGGFLQQVRTYAET